MFSSFRVPSASSLANTEPTQASASQGQTDSDVRGYTRVACNLCRARKLKCSGDKRSCTRCKATRNHCIYPENIRGGSSRKRAYTTATAPSSSEPESTTASVKSWYLEADNAPAGLKPGESPQVHHQLDQTAEFQEADPSFQDSLHSSSTNSHEEPTWEDVTEDPNMKDPALFIFDAGATNLDTFTLPTDSTDWMWSSVTHLAITQDLHNEGCDFGYLAKCSEEGSPAGPPPSPTEMHQVPISTVGQCQCMSSMVQLLELIGLRRVSPEMTGIDGFLECLNKGTQACNSVLVCTQCSLWRESSMLLATVMQQLGSICLDFADLLSSQQRPGTGWEPSRSSPEGTLGGAIWFGRYSIEVPRMRDTLVHNLMILHLRDLLDFLTEFQSKVDRKRGAWALVVESEEKVRKAIRIVQQFTSSP